MITLQNWGFLTVDYIDILYNGTNIALFVKNRSELIYPSNSEYLHLKSKIELLVKLFN